MIFCVSPRMCAATWLTYSVMRFDGWLSFLRFVGRGGRRRRGGGRVTCAHPHGAAYRHALGRAQIYRKTQPAGNRRAWAADRHIYGKMIASQSICLNAYYFLRLSRAMVRLPTFSSEEHTSELQ